MLYLEGEKSKMWIFRCREKNICRSDALARLICDILRTEVRSKLVNCIFKFDEDRLDLRDKGLNGLESCPIQIVDAIG